MKRDDPPFRHPRFWIAMRGFQFLLPRLWEVVSFKLDDHSGIMNFSSEAGAHGQFTWRKVKGVPDIERIVEEVHRQRLNLESPPKLRFTRVGKNAPVFLAHTRPGEVFYASVYNPAEQYLNEWMFPSYSRESAETVSEMLRTYSHNLPTPDSRIQYAMFGLEVSIPTEYRLAQVVPYPADVLMRFENYGRHKIVAHRWGMASFVMQGGSPLNFYHKQLHAKRYSVQKTNETLIEGHEGGYIQFKARGRRGFDFVLGPWWRSVGGAFLKRSENRIYAVEHMAPFYVTHRESVEDVFRSKLEERPS